MAEVSAKIETLYGESDGESDSEEYEILKRVKSKKRKKKKKINASSLPKIEQDVLWAELRTDFGKFKKGLPHVEIPTFESMRSIDSAVMQHKVFSRELKISHGIAKYRMYMAVALCVIEYSLKTFFSMDFDGFALAQWDKISEYEPILEELVAKNYSSKASEWPVEYRLAYTCGVNILLFVILKFIGSKFGPVFAKFAENFISGTKDMNIEGATAGGFDASSVIGAIMGALGGGGRPASREPEFDD